MTVQQQQDPDANIIAIFKNHAIRNEGKSAKAGRPIFDDLEVCELRFPGSKNCFVFPATAMSHWVNDSNGQRILTYAERFARQYQQFKAFQQQTKTGTPLDYLPFLTEGRRAELRALNIFTCEALAAVDGNELKNLGHGGREMKNQAMAYLENSTDNARLTQMQADIDALKARNATLEQDVEAARRAGASEFDGMTDTQLRDHVKAVTGVQPRGNLPRKTLIRMIKEQREATEDESEAA